MLVVATPNSLSLHRPQLPSLDLHSVDAAVQFNFDWFDWFESNGWWGMSVLSDAVTRLPQEVEEGKYEYKLKLVAPPPERVEHLITQMKWRLAEGMGEAMYEVGVADNGELVGLTSEDMDASIATLRGMGERLSADVSIIRKRLINPHDDEAPPRIVAEVLVRKCLPDDQHFLEVRVAILGGADAGKSTLLGVLTHSELDNGRGKSRLNLLRHRHEIESGRTSSISHQIIGFDPRGEIINYGSTNISTWEQVCETAAKVVTFLDTCGHPKYQRTTISGLTGHSPDYSCLIISASAGGVSEIPREHLGISVVLAVPIFIVITKIDIASQDQLTKTVGSLLNLLKSPGVRRVPMIIQNEDDLVVAVSSLVSSRASGRVIPVFLTSSVTGENMDLLIKFFNLLPKPIRSQTQVSSGNVEYSIDDVYHVSGVGRVVGGVLLAGHVTISKGQKAIYYLGPDRGRFLPVHITSIHRQRCPVNHINVGQAATCVLQYVAPMNSEPGSKSYTDTPLNQQIKDIGGISTTTELLSQEKIEDSIPSWFRVRKGQVLLSSPPESATLLYESLVSVRQQNYQPIQRQEAGYPVEDVKSTLSDARPAGVIWEFEADLQVLHAANGLGIGMQGVAYCGSVGQGATVCSLWDRDGRWAKIESPAAAFNSKNPASPRHVPTRSEETRGICGDKLEDTLVNPPNSAGSAIVEVPRLPKSVRPLHESVSNGSLSPTRSPPNIHTTAAPVRSMLPTDQCISPENLNSHERLRTRSANGRSRSPKSGSNEGDASGTPNRRRSRTLSVVIGSASNGDIRSVLPGIDDNVPILCSGDRGRVRFRWVYEPEYITVNSTILFRGEGSFNSVGKVTRLID